MKILVACEFSGIVRDALLSRGHNAWSCDFEATESDGPHIQMDVLKIMKEPDWDLLIAFPPCTHLAASGARWWKDKLPQQRKALRFIQMLMNAPIEKIAIENPVGKISTAIRKPDQIIQPWQFGHGETKATCLWLKNLPKLEPTKIVKGRKSRVHRLSPSKNRWKERSRTLPGIASAMAKQWTS